MVDKSDKNSNWGKLKPISHIPVGLSLFSLTNEPESDHSVSAKKKITEEKSSFAMNGLDLIVKTVTGAETIETT